jgi:hypothetical protein
MLGEQAYIITKAYGRLISIPALNSNGDDSMSDKFYQVVDDDGDCVWDNTSDQKLATLEAALKLAERKARDREAEMYVTVTIKRIGPAKAPLQIVDL